MTEESKIDDSETKNGEIGQKSADVLREDYDGGTDENIIEEKTENFQYSAITRPAETLEDNRCEILTLTSPVVLPRCKFWTTGRTRHTPPDPLSSNNLLKPANKFPDIATTLATSAPRYSSMSNLRTSDYTGSTNQESPSADSTSGGHHGPQVPGGGSKQHYSPNTNVGGEEKASRHVPKRYQRTRSFDDSYADRSPPLPPILPPKYPPGYGNLNPAALLYPAAATYSSQMPAASYLYTPAPYRNTELPYNGGTKLSEDRTIFRKYGPGNSDFYANSFFGWHQAMNGHGPGGRFRPPPAALDIWPPQEINPSGLNNPYSSAWSLNNRPIGVDGFADPFGTANLESPNFNKFTLTSSSHSSRYKRNKWKIGLILGILIIIIAVLVAMGVAVYSQVKTHNSVIKLVRQYRGYFLVTEGDLMDFSAQLLNNNSPQFAQKAALFERKLDGIFELSGLKSIYEGSEITAFRFVVAVPAMEVRFNIKTKVNVNLQVTDLLAVLNDGIRRNVGNLFEDAKIDIHSLTLENRKLPTPAS